MGQEARPNVYSEVRQVERYWRVQRDRWRTTAFVGIFIWLLTIVAVKCG